jgi:hypothetical protein
MEKKKAVKPRKKAAEKKEIVVKEVVRVPEEIISNLVLNGDLSQMNSGERVKYYNHLCQSLNLNPLTQPFQIIKLSGREVLYATKTATEQLRKISGVSVEKIEQRIERDIAITIVSVRDKTGRTDGATGAVNIAGLRGDALANALMKSETKAKRRATLSICGLGMLDESEIETIPNAQVKSVEWTQPEPDIDFKAEAEKIKNRMSEAKTLTALNAIGAEIVNAVAVLPEAERADIRQLYANRLNELKPKEEK